MAVPMEQPSTAPIGDITAFGTRTSMDTRCEVAVRVQAIRPDSRQFRAASFLEGNAAPFRNLSLVITEHT